MPLVFRSMVRLDDGHPLVEASAKGLGVRQGEDYELCEKGMVIIGEKGMSVAPAWRDLPIFRVPKRLGTGGQGKDSLYCFKTSEGPFVRSNLTEVLELLPDSVSAKKPIKHGVIRPGSTLTQSAFAEAIASTRMSWIVDES